MEVSVISGLGTDLLTTGKPVWHSVRDSGQIYDRRYKTGVIRLLFKSFTGRMLIA